jgi:hypothetical protein
MSLIAGKDGISGATSAMEGFATEVGNAIYGVGVLIEKLKSIPGAGVIKQFVQFGRQTSAIGYLTRFGESQKARNAGNFVQSPGDRKKIEKINADALAIQKKLNGLKTIENSATERKIKLTGDQQALEELKKKFDVERIGLFAALNNATDKETQMRLKSLIAIHDNDAALAGKIKAEMAATAATTTLAGSLKALSAEFEFESMRMKLGKSEIASSAIAGSSAGAFTGISPIASSQSALDTALQLYPDFGSEMDAARSAAGRNQVTIQINPAVASLIDVIQNQSASGISPTVNRVSSSYIA